MGQQESGMVYRLMSESPTGRRLSWGWILTAAVFWLAGEMSRCSPSPHANSAHTSTAAKYNVRRMSTLSVIRGGVIGLAAVAAPAAVLFVALGYTWNTSLSGLVPYVAVLCIALALVAWLAWACVRIAHFPPRVAIVLTTLLFILLTIATVPSLAARTILPLLFWAVQLAGALFVAHTATRRARQ